VARALALALLVAGCGSRPAVDYGRTLFSDATLSTAASNPFKCSTCHEVTAEVSKSLPGYSMYDAAVRTSWWGGSVDTLLDATNQCVVEFMRGKPLVAADEKSRALFVYLESLAPDASAPGLPLTVVQNIVDVPSGDAARGKMWWDQGCGNCHGAPHTGDGRISDVASLVPDDSLAAHGTSPTTGARPVVIEKVRHGKFFSVGGNMPLFSVEALSDAQLGDILAYLEGFGLPASP
jgi:thiosulfate dehydrogenase